MFPNLDLSRETAWMYSTLLQIGYGRLAKSRYLNGSCAGLIASEQIICFPLALKFTPVVLIRRSHGYYSPIVVQRYPFF
jgi:hypothetical protein